MTDTQNPGAATGAASDGGQKATTEAVEETSEKGKGVLSKVANWFKHSQEAIDNKIISKAGGKEQVAKWTAENGDEAAKLQAKVGKINKTKAGLVAGAAVLLGSVVAGSGNKGPGERATQIRQQQEAEMATAQGQSI